MLLFLTTSTYELLVIHETVYGVCSADIQQFTPYGGPHTAMTVPTMVVLIKQSLILGTALAMALSVAPAMAGTIDMVKGANGTTMSAAELASVEGLRRRGNSIRIRNDAYVMQKNRCTSKKTD